MGKYELEITVFFSGALTMVLELIAARILSPYVGSSNLIWTTIIGIMLISMSIGYWFGGKIADKNKENDINILSNYLLISAIATSIIPILEVEFIDALSGISNNLILVSIICATVTFGIPSFLLATVSPIAVKIKNNSMDRVGTTSGKISSLSTIGSIFGTFIISSIEGEESDFIKYEYSTYKAIFDDVKVFKVNPDDSNTERQNLILVGIKGEYSINNDKEEEYKDLLNNEIKDFSSDKSIVTDDYAPIGN